MATNPNQLNAKELQRLVELLQRIDGLNQQIADSQAQQAQAAGNARQQLERLEDTYKSLTSDISYAAEGFRKVVQEITNQNIGIKESVKAYKGLTSIADKLQSFQKGYSELSLKDLKKLREQSKIEKQRLENAQELLKEKKLEYEQNKSINEASVRAKQAEIALLENKSGKTRQDYQDLQKLRKEVINLNEDYTKINAKLTTTEDALSQNEAIIANQDELYKGINLTLDETEQAVNNINKSFGLNIGKNLSGALNKAGLGNLSNMLGIDKATEDMKELTKEFTKNGKQSLKPYQQLQVLGGGLKSMAGNLLKGFNPWMIALTGIIKLVQFFIEAMFEADQQVTDIAKSFNVSKDAAREVRDRFFEISDNAKTYAGLLDNQVLNQKELVAANLKINELLGTSIDLSSALGEKGKFLVAQFAAASKFLKLSEEEQKGLLDLQSTSGEEVNKIRNTVLGTTSLYKIQGGALLNERKVLENVLKASNAIKMSTQGGLEGLTKSAIEASKLGLSLQKVSDIANGLLDFESQIAAELEAEVITGRDLNLELAQQAALNNDLATVASEVAKNIGSAAKFSKMNRLEQEALAKAVGMNREELADVLTTQEQLNKLKGTFNSISEKELEQLKKASGLTDAQIQSLKSGKGTVVEYYKALQDAGKTQAEITELLGEQSYASLSAQTAQEKFNETLEKAKETFSRFVDGGYLDKLADALTNFVNSSFFAGSREEAAIRTAGKIETKEDFSKASDEAKKRYEEAKAIAQDQVGLGEKILGSITSFMSPGLVNVAEIKEAKALAASEMLQRAETEGIENVFGVKDGSLNPNGGPVVSTFEKGKLVPVMQGIKEDNVYMTTNKPITQVQDGYYGRTSQDNSQVIAAINRLTEVIMSNSSKEITLAMDGQTVGKVLTPIMATPITREINNTAVAT